MYSCGTVTPHGYREPAHPEPGYFIVGMKSYGRAPTFLMLTGYEQVRSIAAALAGNLQAAQSVELQLPETGVCSVTAGGEAVALRLGLSQEQHEQLLHVTAKHLGTRRTRPLPATAPRSRPQRADKDRSPAPHVGRQGAMGPISHQCGWCGRVLSCR